MTPLHSSFERSEGEGECQLGLLDARKEKGKGALTCGSLHTEREERGGRRER
jgi:hypothetical protein